MTKLPFATPLVTDRRSFLKHSTVLSAGLCGFVGEILHPESAAAAKDPAGLDIIGPKPGYSPQVGTFVSMLTWMREANGVISATKGLTQADLFLIGDVLLGERKMTRARWNNVLAPVLLPLVSWPLGPMVYCIVSATKA
jgi:hypothetical protein